MIVDTNNPAELPEGIEKASIHSIVDHHKLSGLANAEPLEIDMRPLCSATSILYSRAKAAGLTPPKAIAGCMLSGLLSDSLEFRSPTTTEIDKAYALELGKLAGLDVHEHATGMLDAKAQIDHLSPKELVMMDTKVFKIGGKKIRVSVLETTQPAAPMKKQADLVAAQKEIVAEEKLDDMLFFVVDILKRQQFSYRAHRQGQHSSEGLEDQSHRGRHRGAARRALPQEADHPRIGDRRGC